MTDSEQYSAMAEQMVRNAAQSLTRQERMGYLDLADAWRSLSRTAAAFEAKSAPAAVEGEIVPFAGDPDARGEG